MAELLKNHVDREVVELLAARFAERSDRFDAEGFTSAMVDRISALELKGRINLLADGIAQYLDLDYPTALGVVVDVVEGGVGAWAAWPLCSFVERHGLDDPVASLDAMSVLTVHWTCEFAIRPFLDGHLDLARPYLRRWAQDDNEAVRRLASEGTRPLLPWGPKVAALTDDPQIGIELLTVLRHDPSETVRRSVANHLNDVAKVHPDLVVEALRSWTSETEPVEDSMVRHALRTLVKQGHPAALELLGFTTDPDVEIVSLRCEPTSVSLGQEIELTLTLTSLAAEDQLLVIDFVIHHVNISGETSPKVFKWATRRLAAGETIELEKRRSIKNMSTRTYHPGRHQVDLQVAGRRLASTEFVVG